MNEWLYEWSTKWINVWKSEKNVCMHEWMNERMSEWMNERMNDRVDVALVVHAESFSHVFGCFSVFPKRINRSSGSSSTGWTKTKAPLFIKAKKADSLCKEYGLDMGKPFSLA